MSDERKIIPRSVLRRHQEATGHLPEPEPAAASPPEPPEHDLAYLIRREREREEQAAAAAEEERRRQVRHRSFMAVLVVFGLWALFQAGDRGGGSSGSSDRGSATSEGGPPPFDECVRRGEIYFKQIGAWPQLWAKPNRGRDAAVVIRERCGRSGYAFPAPLGPVVEPDETARGINRAEIVCAEALDAQFPPETELDEWVEWDEWKTVLTADGRYRMTGTVELKDRGGWVMHRFECIVTPNGQIAAIGASKM